MSNGSVNINVIVASKLATNYFHCYLCGKYETRKIYLNSIDQLSGFTEAEKSISFSAGDQPDYKHLFCGAGTGCTHTLRRTNCHSHVDAHTHISQHLILHPVISGKNSDFPF